MVEDRITDTRRVAQLLASELSGLSTGPLAAVSVVGADPDATPSGDGPAAYGVEARGERVATVRLYPEYVAVELDPNAVDGPLDGDAVPATERVSVENEGSEGLTIRLEDGASVKDAVDLFRRLLAGCPSDPCGGDDTRG